MNPPGRAAGGRFAISILLILAIMLVATVLLAISIGAAGISFHRLLAAIGLAAGDAGQIDRDRLILLSIRLPRILLSLLVGGLLALAGAVMQGLFRNPLADPALVGVSGGAALAAAAIIVIGDSLAAGYIASAIGISVAAFFGAMLTTAMLYMLATHNRRTSIAAFLLAGIAIAALGNAGIGTLVFAADDRQLRDVTFWMLGSLAGATWVKVGAVGAFFALSMVLAEVISRGLDLFALGEADARYAGVDVEVVKRLSTILIAAAVGAAVSVSGIIGFVGIVVPHILRLLIGPGHRLLLPASVLAGAILLALADCIARTAVAPAELPVGIVTALVGAPFFLWLLLKQRVLGAS